MQNLTAFVSAGVLAASMLAGTAHAQETTADLVSMSAKKLGKEELPGLLAGAKIVYVSARGVTYEYEQKTDGSLSGNASGFQSFHGFSPGHGTWRVNDSGEYCIESVWGRSAPFDNNWCGVVYQAGDNYFLTYPRHPEAKPLKMTIKKS
jgi:hypothetical protein